MLDPTNVPGLNALCSPCYPEFNQECFQCLVHRAEILYELRMDGEDTNTEVWALWNIAHWPIFYFNDDVEKHSQSIFLKVTKPAEFIKIDFSILAPAECGRRTLEGHYH